MVDLSHRRHRDATVSLSEPSGGSPLEAHAERPHSTRASAVWTGLGVAVVLTILLLVFIVQNARSVPVHFLGVGGHFPLALGLLASAVAGALIVLIPGVIRMAQLRRTARRHRVADLREV
ncbi:MAG TPA: lipopolysaccharide assembly protein LapA domain-containing protein [Acidimicrobiales bacterium]|nr:lipopolysaccharide assembly protein LapA domain-containing protein [Acidimicrobiales bacterium]